VGVGQEPTNDPANGVIDEERSNDQDGVCKRLVQVVRAREKKVDGKNGEEQYYLAPAEDAENAVETTAVVGVVAPRHGKPEAER
jgi:hypothetical protein